MAFLAYGFFGGGKCVPYNVTYNCTVSREWCHRHERRFAGAGLHPCGCHSWPWAACFQGESFGSFRILFFALEAGASSLTAGFVGSVAGSVAGSVGSRPSCRGGSALSRMPSSTLICATPLSASLDCSGCTGCCLSGASSADGFSAHRASACAASIFMRSCRIRSWCCSATVGGSKRVCRSHCIHDADSVSPIRRS